MKYVICIVYTLAALFIFGAEEGEELIKLVNGKTVTQKQYREIMQRSNLRRYGGSARKAGSAQGVFVILNCQQKVAASEIDKAVDVIDCRARVQTKVSKAVGITQNNILKEIRKEGGVAGIAIVEGDVSTPALITAAEEGWSIVNVSRLANDNTSTAVLAKRLRCEVLRAFAFSVGGVYGARGDALMIPIREPTDLDKISREDFAIPMMQTLNLTTPRFGLVPWIEKTYLAACQEGWASAPTNEYQKAIWDKVHQMPTEPIKIKPETKKVEK